MYLFLIVYLQQIMVLSCIMSCYADVKKTDGCFCKAVHTDMDPPLGHIPQVLNYVLLPVVVVTGKGAVHPLIPEARYGPPQQFTYLTS